ncbi:MAG: carbohydrate binding domain-containing protein [bacterium]
MKNVLFITVIFLALTTAACGHHEDELSSSAGDSWEDQDMPEPATTGATGAAGSGEASEDVNTDGTSGTSETATNAVAHKLPISVDFEDGDDGGFDADDHQGDDDDEQHGIVDRSSGGHYFCVSNPDTDRNIWDYDVFLSGLDMSDGKFYRMSFTVAYTGNAPALDIRRNLPDEGDWGSIGLYESKLKSGENEFLFQVDGTDGVANVNLQVAFHIGKSEKFCLDDFSMEEVDFSEGETVLDESFSDGIDDWTQEIAYDDAAVINDNCAGTGKCLHFDVSDEYDMDAYQVQVCQDLPKLENGGMYYFSFSYKAENDGELVLEIMSGQSYDNYGVYEQTDIVSGTKWKTVSALRKFFNGKTDENLSDARVCLEAGGVAGNLSVKDLKITGPF